MSLFNRKSEGAAQCSFCGKIHAQVAKLIAGPGIMICDECVIVCCEILAKEMPTWPTHFRAPNDPLKVTCDMLISMRNAGEITEQVFSTRVVEAVMSEFTPSKEVSEDVENPAIP